MNAIGHNENAIRLAALAGDAQIALDKVARGEADAIEGWLAYGAALNEGRALFPGDREFGHWLEANDLNMMATFNLKREAHAALCNGKVAKAEVDAKERIAAMWAAANADQLAEAKANSKARTLRGWHDQWKKIEQDREAARQKAERDAEAARKRDEAKAEAEARAKAEAEARAEASAAKDDEERLAAEARAEAARKAKEAAEKEAEESERASAEPEEEAEEVDPEVAAVMRKNSGLTLEALLRDYAELAVKHKKERAQDKAEIARLKSRLADLEADDKSTVIRRLQKSVSHADSEKWRANEETARAMRQVYALKKRVEELERMGVPL